jgi:type IV pilus assembly protein PilV
MTAPRSHPRRAGYTLIEVMMAIGIMAFGAVGLMALQQATLEGNRGAREVTTATQATRTWLDRVRRDSLKWNARGAPGLIGTDYLNTGITTPNTWFTPVPTAAPTAGGGDGESFAFDYFGRDVLAANAYFCTNLRMQWVIPNQAIRVDARTWWHRSGQDFTDRTTFTNCGLGSEDTGITDDLDGVSGPAPTLHGVYGSTLVRWSQRR